MEADVYFWRLRPGPCRRPAEGIALAGGRRQIVVPRSDVLGATGPLIPGPAATAEPVAFERSPRKGWPPRPG